MDEIPYHQAKEIIEKEVNVYSSKVEGLQLPKIGIERKGKDTSIQFNVNEDVDLYKLLNKFVATIGEMELNVFGDTPCLRYDNVTIFIYAHLLDSPPSINFSKKGDLTSQEIDAILNMYKLGNSIKEKSSPGQRLAEFGVTIYSPDNAFNWNYIAGYEKVKQEIKDTVILPLKHLEMYEKIAKGTRKIYETNRPKAVLFEGPPGTGKTTTARIIAGEVDAPMVYVPVESIMTKWYGESERNLAGIFDACHDLGDSLMFLDEIDSLATSRDKDLHEATRRVLSVLLRKIDGFEPKDKTILVGATNRKNDLDPALLSRFDVSIHFPLPNLEERAAIFGNYARHLDAKDLETLAKECDGISGRNIKDVCEYSERRWASKLIRGSETAELPVLEEYLDSLKIRIDNNI